MRKSRRSQVAERADQAFVQELRGPSAPAVPSTPHGAQPVPQPDGGVQTENMPYVATAAPSPVLGVSPILGESVEPSPPPVGSFTAPSFGPPGPAYSGQTQSAGSAEPAQQHASGLPAGAEPLHRNDNHLRASVIDQAPFDFRKPAMAAAPRPQSFPLDGHQPLLAGGADLPLLLGPGGVAPHGDLVTCPECGEMATVDAARRNAQDFCRNCDFPLFWARTTVVLPSGEENGASLRRLPGTVGRAATAALMCPHCGEPNSPVAQHCVRCLLPMHPVEYVAPPVFLPAPRPEPEPVVVDEGRPWWWILLVSTCLLAIVAFIGWAAFIV